MNGFKFSPRNRAIGRALGRRALFGASKAGSIGLYGLAVALCFAAMMLVVSIWMMLIEGGQLSGGSWGEDRPWMSPLAIAALMAWGAWDAARSPSLFQTVTAKRPFQALILALGSGLYLMMDRMGQLLSLTKMGFARDLPPSPASFDWAKAPVPSSWRECLAPWRDGARGAAFMIRHCPLAIGTLAWGMAGVAACLALMIPAYLEMGAWALAARIKAGGSLGKRASEAMELLASEGAADLARVESEELERQAAAGAASSGPRRI